MSKQVNVRLDDAIISLLDEMVSKIEAMDLKSSRTDVIQKAIYLYANDHILGSEKTGEILDKSFREL